MSVFLTLYARIKRAQDSANHFFNTGSPKLGRAKHLEAENLRAQLREEIEKAERNGWSIPSDVVRSAGPAQRRAS